MLNPVLHLPFGATGAFDIDADKFIYYPHEINYFPLFSGKNPNVFFCLSVQNPKNYNALIPCIYLTW